MKSLTYGLLAAMTVGGLANAATAAVIDNFDGYADQTAFNAAWTPTGTAMTLDTDGTPVPPSSPNTIAQGTVAQQSRIADTTGITLRNMDFSFDFYDEQGTASLARTYGMVYSRGTTENAAWTDALNQIVAVGKYNGIATPKYAARIAFGSVNWTALDAATSPDRSVGWHTFRVLSNGAATPTLTITVDGLVGKQVALTEVQGDVFMNWVVMGSGLSSTHGANFDNVSLTAIPEPAGLALAGLAGLGLLRRRCQA